MDPPELPLSDKEDSDVQGVERSGDEEAEVDGSSPDILAISQSLFVCFMHLTMSCYVV
jgi:hypothetical protein